MEAAKGRERRGKKVLEWKLKWLLPVYVLRGKPFSTPVPQFLHLKKLNKIISNIICF